MSQATAEKQNMQQKELEANITAVLNGDKDAFQYLYRYAFSTVESECYKVLHNRQDIDDCMQESFIKIYNGLGKLKDYGSYLGWCRRIAHNVSVSFIDHRDRKEGKDQTMPPVGDESQIGLDSVRETHRSYDPEQSADMELASAVLSDIVGSMAPMRAMAMSLYQQGYSYQEIAEELTIPLGTVKSHISYAKRQIHLMVEKLEKEEGIYLHGYTIVPTAAGGFLVNVTPKETAEGTGWISGSAATGSKHQEALWKRITKKVPELAGTAADVTVGSQILKFSVILIAAMLVISGIYYAIQRIPKTTDEVTTTISTTIEETSVQKSATSNTISQRDSNNSQEQPQTTERSQPYQPEIKQSANSSTLSERTMYSIRANNPRET